MPLNNVGDNNSQFSTLVNAVMASASADNVGTDNQPQPFAQQQHDSSVSRKRDAAEISNLLPDMRAQQQPQQQQQQQQEEPLLCLPADGAAAAAKPFESIANSIQQAMGMGVTNRNARSRRLPCKARGMGDSHTSATAFFDIPAGLQHGAVLACSHPACAGSGRRFRYCQVCEVPVAKRNFQKRHSHGLVPVGDPMLMASVNVNRGQNDDHEQVEGKHRRSVSYDAADTLNQLCGAKKAAAEAKVAAAAASHDGEKPVSINLSAQEFQWLALLHNRPSVHDHSGMEKWMTNIIDTSERNNERSNPDARTETVTPPTPPQEQAQFGVPPPPQEQAQFGVPPPIQPKAAETPSEAKLPLSAPAPSYEQVQTISSLPPPAAKMDKPAPASGFGLFMSSFASSQPNQPANQSTQSTQSATASTEKNDMFPPPVPKTHLEMKKPAPPPPEDETGYETEQHSNAGNDEQRKMSAKAAASTENPPAKDEEDKSPPQTLADYTSRKKQVAARAARLLNSSDSKETAEGAPAPEEDDQSHSSSVLTRPQIRRRRSVQNARELMGLIKLSGMKENDFDEIF